MHDWQDFLVDRELRDEEIRAAFASFLGLKEEQILVFEEWPEGILDRIHVLVRRLAQPDESDFKLLLSPDWGQAATPASVNMTAFVTAFCRSLKCRGLLWNDPYGAHPVVIDFAR